MDANARNLSYNLDSVAKALAEWTVSRHAEVDPSLTERFGSAWRRQWVEDVLQRIRLLAQSVAVGRPQVLADAVTWSRLANRARDMPDEDLRSSIKCLREVLGSQLQAASAEIAIEHLDYVLDHLTSAVHADVPGRRATASPHRQLVLKYLDHVLSGRRRDAEQLILDAATGGVPVPELYRDVLQPALTEIGSMWHVNEISIADEHFATATTESALSLLRMHFAAAPANGHRVLATAVAGELHAIPVRMVADLFEMNGWDALYLGANTPTDDIASTVVEYDVDLVAASTMSSMNLRTMGEMVEAVHGLEGGRRVIVGGAPFRAMPDLWKDLGADGGATSAEEAVRLGNQLVGAS